MDGPSLLDAYLRDRGVSLRAFADKVGASPSAVLNWRRGDAAPGAAFLGRIRDEAGIPLDAWIESAPQHKGAAKGSKKRGAKARHASTLRPRRGGATN